MSSDPVVSTTYSPLPTTVASVPDVPIQITGGILLHIGPMNGKLDPREYKGKGYKLVWILTREELKANMPLADEGTFVWDSDAQLRRLFHDQMHQWTGAMLVPEGEKQERVAGIMAELIALQQFNDSSNKILSADDLPMRNAIRNWQWYENGLPLSRVREKGKGAPVVLIAAGPSLNDQWPYLRAYREKHRDVPFIVCGRTYKKAMAEGVWPEFVMEVEQYDWDAEIFTFAPAPPEHTILAFPCTAAPRLAKAWPGHKLCLLNHNFAKLMGLPMTPPTESVMGGNSVLHYMVTLADILGASPLYIAGMDFGYPKGKGEDTHAAGTFHAWSQDVLNTEHTHQQEMTAEGNDGAPLMTSPPYKNFGTYLSVQIEYMKTNAMHPTPDLKVYSFSKRGLRVAGVEYVDIAEVAK